MESLFTKKSGSRVVHPLQKAKANSTWLAELNRRFPDGMHSKNSQGQIPLVILMMEKPANGWLITACLDRSIEDGVNFNTEDLAKNSPLKIALIQGMPEDFLEKLILNGKANPDFCDVYNQAKQLTLGHENDPRFFRHVHFCQFVEEYRALAPAERSAEAIHSLSNATGHSETPFTPGVKISCQCTIN
jgi:hypothetical protein